MSTFTYQKSGDQIKARQAITKQKIPLKYCASATINTPAKTNNPTKYRQTINLAFSFMNSFLSVHRHTFLLPKIQFRQQLSKFLTEIVV